MTITPASAIPIPASLSGVSRSPSMKFASNTTTMGSRATTSEEWDGVV
jgi:hypothetical protein